jgi:hypothetical protein
VLVSLPEALATTANYDLRGLPQQLTDSEGRFCVRGGWPAGTYKVSYWCTGFHRAEGCDVDPIVDLPLKDVSFRLVRMGTGSGCILGSVLFGPMDDQRQGIVVKFRQRGSGARCQTVGLDPRGVVYWGAAPPGIYDASIAVDGIDDARENLLQVDGISVAADEVTLDPRLQSVDLRGRLHDLSVTVLDDKGNSVPSLVRAYVPDAPDQTSRLRWFDSNPAKFLTVQPTLDIVVYAAGGAIASMHSASGEVKVHVEPGHPIRATLVMDSADQILTRFPGLAVMALPIGSGMDGWVEWLNAPVNAGGNAVIELPGAGRWRVVIRADRDIAGHVFPSRAIPTHTVIEVEEGSAETTFPIRLDPDALAALAKETRR